MDETKLTLLVMTVAVLLPIVPALILFKSLPSQGQVKGPFKGLQIKFGGAFAGYLVIFLLILRFMPSDYTRYETWTVRGKIDFKHGPDEEEPNGAEISVRLVPPHLVILDQGLFTFEIPVTGKPDGTRTFPTLHVTLRGYQSLTIPLDPRHLYGAQSIEVQRDEGEKTIDFKQPLVMQTSTYAATEAQQAKPIK
jgi:hypothetical protein